MSQISDSLVVPSQLHSDASSLHYHRCWWAWCRHNFYTRKELLVHVDVEHVQKARPVRLADIHALETAENSYWDSLDIETLPALPSSSPSHPEIQSQEGGHRQANLIDMPSSLPSPPTSSPQGPGTPVRVQPSTGLPMNNGLPQLFRSLVPRDMSNGLFTPSSKQNTLDVHMSTPSFASLSSQSGSPDKPSYDIPESPCFDLLVAEATKRPAQPIPELPEIENSNDGALSPSEGSSQELVFNHLTQGVDDEESSQELEGQLRNGDVNSPSNQASIQPNLRLLQSKTNYPAVFSNQELGLLPSAPLQVQTRQQDPITSAFPSSPSYLHSPVYPFTTPIARQSWYQPRRRRSSKKKSASEASGSHSSPATSPITKPATPLTSPIPTNFLPVAAQAVHSSNSLPSPVLQSTPQPPEQFSQSQGGWTAAYSSQMSSYPPLQTQAPLRSQSLSQD